ncbi:histidine kinase N-terminal 7TM domain-containing protein [Thalassovita taeanensis]|uniref:sensor histidine kinase n=1 Tax=Thalassovita taeanensis TaxID=657014 RepID=UPI001586FC86|nr:histidine kinase N-terminal 7TM domain-containing protein [Thalassovita taeanensis]
MNCLAAGTLDFPVIATMVVWTGSALFSLWVWQQHQFPGKAPFLMAQIAMLWWLFTAGFELSSSGLDCKVFWAQAAWPGIVLLPSSWALFMFHYALGQERGRPRLRHLIMWIGPTVVSVQAFTNGYHHLFYREGTRLIEIGGRMSVEYEHGPLFYLAAAYVYLFMLASIAICIVALRRSAPNLRPFFLVLLIITLAPIAGNLGYITMDVTIFGFDPTPFMFSFIIGAFGWLVVNNRMMDISSIARDLLFYSTKNPIIIFDDSGALSGFNPQVPQVISPSFPKIGESLLNEPEVGSLVTAVIETGALPPSGPLHWKGHSYNPVLFPISSPINPDGPVVGWTLAFTDITEQLKHTNELKYAARQAEAANLAKTEFISTVSHELRTPLTSIQGSLDILASGKLGDQTDPAMRLLKIAKTNTYRLRQLIDDLLDLQRIEQGKMDMVLRPLDLGPLIKDALDANEGYLARFRVRSTLTMPDELCQIRGDAQRLAQVLANLLSNAAKFSYEDDVISVSVTSDEDHVTIAVQDHGVGIPKGVEDKVFGRFSQVDSSLTRQRGGSGLGMNITQLIVEGHAGTIWYDSAPGKGTTFFVRLPCL